MYICECKTIFQGESLYLTYIISYLEFIYVNLVFIKWSKMWMSVNAKNESRYHDRRKKTNKNNVFWEILSPAAWAPDHWLSTFFVVYFNTTTKTHYTHKYWERTIKTQICWKTIYFFYIKLFLTIRSNNLLLNIILAINDKLYQWKIKDSYTIMQ